MEFTPLFRFVSGEFQEENLQLFVSQSLNNNWTSQTATSGGHSLMGSRVGPEWLLESQSFLQLEF